METIGPFTIVCDNPHEDIPKILRLLGKIARLRGTNAVRFDNGAAFQRTAATRPTPTPIPAIEISDFMGRRQRPTV